jgi:hypothetical protein
MNDLWFGSVVTPKTPEKRHGLHQDQWMMVRVTTSMTSMAMKKMDIGQLDVTMVGVRTVLLLQEPTARKNPDSRTLKNSKKQ